MIYIKCNKSPIQAETIEEQVKEGVLQEDGKPF
jgi:hypothetical protein